MSYTSGLDKPESHFLCKIYTGTGSSQTLSGIGFNADLIWLKNRTDSSTSHVLTDSVRTNAKYLKSDANSSEGTYTFVSNRGSDGYDVASHSWSGASSKNYVAWNWLAGGSASSNSNGTITSSVSANTTAGFSIATYTGTGSSATVGHGLGVTPAWIMVKCRSESQDWFVYHQGLGGNVVRLNGTSAAESSSGTITSPNSTIFNVGTAQAVNKSSGTYVAYCFAEKIGYSKFSSYVGNGNSDGTFVHTGFRPAWLLAKKSSGTGDWFLIDNKRSTINPTNHQIEANSSAAEDASGRFDFLSNGFKCVSSSTGSNGSGTTYIYMAFAESPFVNSNGVPNNAK